MAQRRCVMGIAAFVAAAVGAHSGARAATAPPQDDWTAYGRTADEQRFSPLTQINAGNVGKLGLAWSLDLERNARTLEATPLEVDGILYFTTSLSILYAVDAVTGKQLWRYDPQVWKVNPRAMRTIQGYHRGVAYLDGHLFLGTSDGRLQSIDARTGQVTWTANTVEDPDSRKQITGAPRIFNGKVIIGHAGADFGTRGYVTAYEAKTGKKLWRFYTVPGNPALGFEDDAQALAAKTWTGEWWRWGGGGTAWNAMTFDPELNRIYIGTGNSSNYNPRLRSPGGGDNLFLASIVALDADTGKYVWHYQVNPAEAWDWKATTDMILARLSIDGHERRVLMQAPTNGFFYVIDRDTGKLLSAQKLGKVTWAKGIDIATGRPIENENIRYENGPVTLWPSCWGIHNWQPMAYSPQTRLVYIPTMELSMTYQATPQDVAEAPSLEVGGRRYWFPIGASMYVKPVPGDGNGALTAWDPVQQRARWKVELPSMWNGGVLATAGELVFQGTGSGLLAAYAADTGKELWRFDAHNGIVAPPITFSHNGTQYVTVLVGYGGATTAGIKAFDPGWRFGKQVPRVLTFRLDGKAQLPPQPAPDFSVRPVTVKDFIVDEAAAARGGHLFAHTCSLCHGPAGVGAGPIAPDLRESLAAHDLKTLYGILKDGTLASGGMPQFDERTDEEVSDLRNYIEKISRAKPL